MNNPATITAADFLAMSTADRVFHVSRAMAVRHGSKPFHGCYIDPDQILAVEVPEVPAERSKLRKAYRRALRQVPGIKVERFGRESNWRYFHPSQKAAEAAEDQRWVAALETLERVAGITIPRDPDDGEILTYRWDLSLEDTEKLAAAVTR